MAKIKRILKSKITVSLFAIGCLAWAIDLLYFPRFSILPIHYFPESMLMGYLGFKVADLSQFSRGGLIYLVAFFTISSVPLLLPQGQLIALMMLSSLMIGTSCPYIARRGKK